MTDGPRRSGSSFRVSLKPNRHRHSSQWGRSSTSSHNDDGSGSDEYLGSGNLKKLVFGLMASVLIGTGVHLMEPNTDRISQLYDIYDKLSTEDLVAQGEMSSRTFSDDEIGSLKPDSSSEADLSAYMLKRAGASSSSTDKSSLRGGLATSTASTPGTFSSQQSAIFATISLQDSLSNQEVLTIPAPEVLNATDKTYTEIDLPSDAANRTDWGPSFQLREEGKATMVAYILPIYSCYKLSSQPINHYGLNDPGNDKELHDAALMLQASIHKNSARNPASSSAYDYEMVALVHKHVEQCDGGANRTEMLRNLGYRVEVVREPINQLDMKNQYLKNHAPKNNGGRTGIREMIRLYAFKLVEYKIAVLVDTTTWILNAPDAIFDVLLNGARNHSWVEHNPDHIVKETFYPNGKTEVSDPLPSELEVMYTRDYSAMKQGSWDTGVSLSFLPVRPNLRTFRQLIKTFQTTDYNHDWGWDRKGYVNYAGSMTTKGLLTYYFNELMPDRRLELHRCIYNNMADVPFIAGKSGASDYCRDVKEHKNGPDGNPVPCTDCRINNWGDIIVANFQVCQVPWVCPYVQEVEGVPLLVPTLKMCRQFHQSWFALRASVETSFLAPEERTKTTGTYHPEIFNGYCIPGGERGGAYIAMGVEIKFPHGISNNRNPVTA